MRANKNATRELEDIRVNVKLKLAALWASLMFVYLYVDVISFYKPGVIEDILAGIVWEFEITQGWALGGLALMTFPSLMVFLSLAMPAKVNRWMNIIVAALYVAVSIGNAIGESWVFYFVFAAIVEVALLLLVVRYAWKWPKVEM
ncbi:MAG: hypothetical protein FJ320_06870 [SAR202 cluster bacterium]|nr:hypothetical protein [SAR202 cluster bacterium]